MYKADKTTVEMANFPIDGNIVDHSWPFIIIRENGKPDHLAIALLAHVVYWYRPGFDQATKQLGKKYKGDLLQRSYPEIEDMLGLTKREAQEAFQRLEKLDIVHRVLRTIEIGGQKISNILFIKFNHHKLKAMREDFFNKCIPIYAEKDEGVREKGQGDTPNVMTYTETTSEISQETTTTQQGVSGSSSESEKLKELAKFPVASTTAEKALFYSLDDVKIAIECCLNPAKPIDNADGYLMSALKEKWQPKPNKAKIEAIKEETQKNEQQTRQKICLEAKQLELAHSMKFTDNFKFSVTETDIKLKIGAGWSPLPLNETSMKYLKDYIQKHRK